MKHLEFPPHFIWGAATSSYQIEGASREDGKGPSIWDAYSSVPGKIKDGSNGNVACDHYHRYGDDIDILSDLGCGAYRFSIAWPRIFPDGKGAVNRKGIDFYKRLIERLRERNIEPFATIFHWDLPLALADSGGWTNRDTAERFADYAFTITDALGDLVTYWATFNEILSVFWAGYIMAEHAPGLRDEWKLGGTAVHHMLLGHGKAVQRIRSNAPSLKLGIVEGFYPAFPVSQADQETADLTNEHNFRFTLDPALTGAYPPSVLARMSSLGVPITPDDLSIIHQKLDYIGVNNYTRMLVQRNADEKMPLSIIQPDYPGVAFTDIGWEIFPDSIYRAIMLVKKNYGDIPVYVTENGAAFNDQVTGSKVEDTRRIEYLKGYIGAVWKAIQEGCDVRGYFVWSLLDNFEWGHGFSQRFGIVHVDFETLKRTIKESGRFYSRIIADNGLKTE